MIAAIIISAIFVILGIWVAIGAIVYDWEDWAFHAGIVITIVSFSIMICCALYHRKQYPKEYPASEYTFKIKVIEFEEQRDTILVVIPKGK